jgi:hypothetical protein
MNDDALDHIRFATRHFNDLQGLRYAVPLGMVTLALGGVLHFAGWPAFLPVPVSGAALLLALAAGRYYQHVYGEVQAEPAYPAGELQGLSIYSPAEPTPRLVGFQQLTPRARHFLALLLLTAGLCWGLQLTSRNVAVLGSETAGQHPRIHSAAPLEYDPYLGWLSAFDGIYKPPGTVRAIYGQMAYAVCGAFFLGLWLWRERRASQRHHLALAVLLLGFSVLGTSLGLVVREDGEVGPVLDFLAPVLVYPGVALLLCGAAMTLAGLYDHWQLARALGGSAVESSHE